ncbi:MAG TPA: protein glxC, partial [Methylophilaceae bacterium]|nr:protein glxC [Methylophilaceae bacterium]
MENIIFDLDTKPLREVNQYLHGDAQLLKQQTVTVVNPNGAHNIAVGLKAKVDVTIDGHAGYYAAGMNQLATVT